MNTLIPWISSPVIAASITAIATVFAAGLGIYFARRIPSVDRNHLKRLAVIEIAKKRLEVRDQALQLELSATEDKNEQEQAKLRARQAVQRIISDADSWMDYLEWDTQITRILRKKPHTLKPRRMSRTDRIFYVLVTLCGWLFFIVGLLFFASLAWMLIHHDNRLGDLLTIAATAALAVAFMWGYATFSREAQKIKFPKPDAPIFAEV